MGRLEPSRRRHNGDGYGYDGYCDHGEVGGRRNERRAVEVHESREREAGR